MTHKSGADSKKEKKGGRGPIMGLNRGEQHPYSASDLIILLYYLGSLYGKAS